MLAADLRFQIIDLKRLVWRRRPDLNRGWRFCRFNGVVNRIVSCWSLVCPAPPFYLVLGPYWTTFGLRLPMIAAHRDSAA